jgi:hypothetical protein
MHKNNHRSLRRHLSMMLVVVFIMSGSIFFSGCMRISSAWREITGNIRGADDDVMAVGQRLSEIELVQLLTNAVRGDAELPAYYNSISVRQLDGLTLDEFQQYIRFLRRGISGDVHSFTVMSESELIQNQEDMIAAVPQFQELIEASSAYQIIYRQSGKSDEKFAVYFQQAEDGSVYLSSVWIRQILKLNAYATLYFDAIDSSDTEALAYLLDQSNPNSPVILAKAEFLIDFYKNNISSRTSEYSLKSARVDNISYDQFGIVNLDGTQSVSRTVSFHIDQQEQLNARDKIVNVLNVEDLAVYRNDQLLFTLAERDDDRYVRTWSYRLEQATGLPFEHDDGNCKPYGDGVSLMNLVYNGLKISVQGDCQEHKSWNGIVRSASLIDTNYHTGSGLMPGMSEDELLVRYPFAAESGYRLRFASAGGTVSMNVILENKTIDRIELSFIPLESY